jgi:hypothetical protein
MVVPAKLATDTRQGTRAALGAVVEGSVIDLFFSMVKQSCC